MPGSITRIDATVIPTALELENIVLKRKIQKVLKINQNLQIELAVSENLLDEISTRQEVDLKKVIKDKITTERIQSEYIEGLKYSLIELHKRCKDLEINQITTTSIKSQEIITNTEKTIEVLKSRRLSMDKVESSYKSWNETCKVYFWDMNLLEGELLDQDYTLKGSTLRTLFEAFVTRSMQIECHKFVNVEAHICWCCELDTKVSISNGEFEHINNFTNSESDTLELEVSDTESFVEVDESNSHESTPILVSET